MPLSARGRNIHKHLVNKALRYFSEKGYTTFKESRLEDKSRLDLLAIKGSERIGLDCQLTVSYKIMRDKFLSYGPTLTKLIFFVPKEREAKTRLVLDRIAKENGVSKNFFDLWTENVDVQSTVRISRKTKHILDSIGKKNESYDDVMLKILEHCAKCRKYGRVKK